MTFNDNDGITLWRCLTCVHRIDLDTCKAFLDGIPEEIVRERVVHDKPYPGDNLAPMPQQSKLQCHLSNGIKKMIEARLKKDWRAVE
jgi:hypothetical protein